MFSLKNFFINLISKTKFLIKKNRLLYLILEPIYIRMSILLRFIERNKSLIDLKKSNHSLENIFIIDSRVHSMQFDIINLLIRGSNFFYNNKWSLIIYEDTLFRHESKKLTKEIYFNNFINIFFQTLTLLPNQPINIKFIQSSHELLNIINKSKKIFPIKYNFFSGFTKDCHVRNFNTNDLENFKKNQPILKAPKYFSKIFENYLNYRDIKKYNTITIRSKSWNNTQWNTDENDIEIYLKFIKEKNFLDYSFLIIPDTEKDVPKPLIELLESRGLKYHIFHHGSFSIPMRFLAYSNAYYNFCSTNGPANILCFIQNNLFYIFKDPVQSYDYIKFVKQYNKELFKNRKFIFHKKFS